MRGGCRQTCRHDLEFIGSGSRPTCRLAVNARWRPPYLLLYSLNAAVDLPSALPQMRGGSRLICCIEAEVILPAASL